MSFFAVCLFAGYGVYWWHESSLDRIAVENLDHKGPAVEKTLEFLKSDGKNSDAAKEYLERLPAHEKVGVLKTLAHHEMTAVRTFAVRCMRPLRDIPQIRAELARIAREDRDDSVARLASRALAGKR